MRRTTWLTAALVALAAAGALGGAPRASAASATITEVGWWTRDPAAPSPPEGGLGVSNAPDGPLTVSAVRIHVPSGGAGTVTLTLPAAESTSPLGAGLRACATRSVWAAATGGGFDEAPEPDCGSGSVTLEQGDDGSWTGDITPIAAAGSSTVSAMIVPAEGAPAAFKLTFGPPVLSSTGAAEPATPPTSRARPAPPPAASTSTAPPPSTLSLTDPPDAIPASGTDTAAAPPVTSADPLVALPTRPPGAEPSGGGGKDWGQLVRLLLGSLAFGVVLAGSRRALVVIGPKARLSAAIAGRRTRRGPSA